MSAGDERMDSQAYTISEVSAGFNLIVTDLVKCIIVSQNARKMHHSEAENWKIFSGGALPPPQTPPQTPPPRRLWRIVSAPAARRYLDLLAPKTWRRPWMFSCWF